MAVQVSKQTTLRAGYLIGGLTALVVNLCAIGLVGVTTYLLWPDNWTLRSGLSLMALISVCDIITGPAAPDGKKGGVIGSVMMILKGITR